MIIDMIIIIIIIIIIDIIFIKTHICGSLIIYSFFFMHSFSLFIHSFLSII